MVSLWLFGEEKLKDFAKFNWNVPREEPQEIKDQAKYLGRVNPKVITFAFMQNEE